MHQRRTIAKFFCGLLALFCSGCGPKKPSSLPQDSLIQVYFNHRPVVQYREPYRNIERQGDNLEALMIESIQGAKVSVDVAVQELRLPLLARALADKKQKGVRVRIILENTYHQPFTLLSPAQVKKLDQRQQKKYQELQSLVDSNKDGQVTTHELVKNDAISILTAAGVPVLDDGADGSKGSDLMHHKFIIIDGQKVIVTSANFTPSDVHGDFSQPASRGNANNLVILESVKLAQLFTEEFNQMWGDGSSANSKFGVNKRQRLPQTVQIGNSRVSLQFSPTSAKVPWEQSANGLIASVISSAKQSVDLALFVFSEQRLSSLLEARHQQGVQVRALSDPNFAYRNYSEILDLLGVQILDQRCRPESGNRPWQNPITTAGVPTLATGDLLHHKFATIDNQIVITGSHNWSDAANQKNDETLLVIENPVVTAHFGQEFNQLYAGAQLGLPASVQKKVQQQAKKCLKK